MLTDIIEKINNNIIISKEEILFLLSIENASTDYNEIINLSNELSRKKYNNKGYVFAQIGINAEPCSKNCKFCSMAASNYSMDSTWKKCLDEIVAEAKAIIKHNVDDLFLMITADYDINHFINIAKSVRNLLPPQMKLVANMGDFDIDTAKNLKEAGFTGVYHIHRLREGIDTGIPAEIRINTLNAIKEAGLELYYCVEPIGPEHSYDEIADEIIRARNYNVEVMAVMRRIAVAGTPLYELGEISDLEFTKIAAVTRLAVNPSRSMNAHETLEMTLNAGINQLYAEVGANPRDIKSNTERGWNIEKTSALLNKYNYHTSTLLSN